MDVLRRAQDIKVTLAKTDRNQSGSNELLSTMSRGVKVEADALFEKEMLEECDAIVLPGGLGGATSFSNNAVLIE